MPLARYYFLRFGGYLYRSGDSKLGKSSQILAEFYLFIKKNGINFVWRQKRDMCFILHLYRCIVIIILQYNIVKSFFKINGEIMNKIIEKQIGSNIRNIREESGITQEELSAKLQLRGCDITRSAIAKIEVGQRHLYPDEIILIKEILNTEYETIFCVNDVPE